MDVNVREASPETALEVRPIEDITEEILFFKQSAGMSILEIGKRLIEAKAQLSHGDWLPWLKEKVEFSEASAQRFMKLANEYSNPSALTDLGATKALILLALEPSERDDFIAQKHEVSGTDKTVQEMSSRELEKAIKELKKAKADAAEMQDKLDAIQSDYDALVNKAQREVNELAEQLEEARNNPANTTVVEVIDNAETDKLNAELDKKAAHIAKLEEDLKKSKAKLDDANRYLDDAKRAAKDAAQRTSEEHAKVTELEKRLSLAASPELAEFKLYFEQSKDSINRMISITEKAVSDNSPNALKMRVALTTMLEKTLDIIDKSGGAA